MDKSKVPRFLAYPVELQDLNCNFTFCASLARLFASF